MMRDIIDLVRSLAKNACACFYGADRCRWYPQDQEKCIFFLDDVDDQKCKYFEKYVLPIDPQLEAAYFAAEADDTCEHCSLPMIKSSNRQKYCSACADEIRRERDRRRKTNRKFHI